MGPCWTSPVGNGKPLRYAIEKTEHGFRWVITDADPPLEKLAVSEKLFQKWTDAVDDLASFDPNSTGVTIPGPYPANA